MSIRKRDQLYSENPERWGNDPNKFVSYELEFDGTIMEPGTKFKVKGEHTIYVFTCLVHHIEKDVTWIECQEEKGGYRSFYPSKISKVMTAKRSYRKKNV